MNELYIILVHVQCTNVHVHVATYFSVVRPDQLNIHVDNVHSLSLYHQLRNFFQLLFQKIPVRELRTSDKSDIVELAVIMKTGVCPFIVVFYGCLVRDVSAKFKYTVFHVYV